MSIPLDLRQIEKKVFRTTYEDGLWDVYVGGIVASMAMLAYLPEEDPSRFLRYGLFLLGIAASFLVFRLGKKLITEPRLGKVVFGSLRKRRKATLAAILGSIVGLQALIVLGTILLWNNPQWAESLGLAGSQPAFERLLIAVVGALFVGPSMTLVAYFNDFPRGYYIAVLMSLAVFMFIWFRSPLPLLVTAALIFIPGVVLFIRFLLKYPLPPAEAQHGG